MMPSYLCPHRRGAAAGARLGLCTVPIVSVAATGQNRCLEKTFFGSYHLNRKLMILPIWANSFLEANHRKSGSRSDSRKLARMVRLGL